MQAFPDGWQAKVIVIGTVPPEGQPSPGAAVNGDLGLLAVMGGRERTETEFRDLFAVADLSILSMERIVPQTGNSRVITAVCRSPFDEGVIGCG